MIDKSDLRILKNLAQKGCIEGVPEATLAKMAKSRTPGYWVKYGMYVCVSNSPAGRWYTMTEMAKSAVSIG